MTRRCSHCSNNGHNSRTCPTRGGVKLFGVHLTDGSSIRKSASMSNLSSAAALLHSPSSAAASPPSSSDPVHEPDGYLSDDPAHASCSVNRRNERKKGTPWSEAEHRLFLLGLQKRGKGDWRGISTHFVKSRSPTQVASHAQKYFIRQTNATRRKRRSSLFDMVTDLATEPPPVPEEPFLLPSSQEAEPENPNSLPSLNLSLNTDFEPMEATSTQTVEEPNEPIPSSSLLPPMIPTFFVPIPFQIWPPNPGEEQHNHNHNAEPPHHQVLKPIPKLTKEPLKVDVGMSMSQLSIKESKNNSQTEPLLSLTLPGGSSRQSAFHASVPVATDGTDLSKGKSSVIQAV